jgi:energy-coupling factor transport system ATP-binding protein
MDEAVEADRILVLNEGEDVMLGTPNEIFRRVDQLKSLGLDVPQVTELVHELNKEGYDFRDDVLSVEELVDIL